jgi:hypothetical protein
LGDFPQLGVGQTSGSRDFALDDELGHGRPLTFIYPSKRMERLQDGLAKVLGQLVKTLTTKLTKEPPKIRPS